MSLLGSMGGVVWGSQAKARSVISNQKGGVLVSSTGVHQGKALGGKEEIVDHKGCWGSHIRNLHFLVTLRLLCRESSCIKGLVSV